MIYLGIDPGLTGTGVSLVSNVHDDITQLENTVIYSDGSLSKLAWHIRAANIASKLSLWLKVCNHYPGIDDAIIELPAFWGTGSVVGNAAAKSGDLIALAATTGVIIAALQALSIDVVCYTPQQWKGQLPKEAVAARINRRMGPIPYRNHANDALGIVLYHLGVF